MTEGEELLDPQEIEFLLSSGQDAPPEETGTHAAQEQGITMRGDLKQIDLADIFQTLAMSKMEGMLRVRNPLEQREVFFREGLVRCLVPTRVETRRLGQMLVSAGLINPEQLRAALLAQRKVRKPIGQVLVEEGAVTEEQVAEVAENQLTEDLYNLFTWKHGSFEFYRGPCLDPLMGQRLEQYPELDVSGVLLEVARRSDEWGVILETVRSLDEVPVRTETADEDVLEQQQRVVLQAVDGMLNIRELADASLLGLFDCARVVKELYERDMLKPASAERIVEVAEGWLSRGEMKRALVTVQTLYERSEDRDLDTTLLVSDLLKRCGESRLAGGVLLEAAQQTGSSEETLTLARQARELDPRNPEVLTLLQHELRNWGSDPEELLEVTGALADALRDEGHLEEALAIVDDLQEQDPGAVAVLTRKARLLHRLKRPAEAIQTLESLAEVYESNKQRDQLIGVYEQILKIDHDRKDIARQLKTIHAGKLGGYRRMAITAGSILVACAAAGIIIQSKMESSELNVLGAQVDRHLAQKNPKLAIQLVSEWEAQHGSSSDLDVIRANIDARVAAINREEAAAASRRRQARLGEAGELITEGRCVEALAIYKELMQEAPAGLNVKEAVRIRISSLATRFEKLERDLKFSVPDPVPEFVPMEKLEQVLVRLEEDFLEADLEAGRGVLAAENNPNFGELVPPEDRTRLVSLARAITELFETAYMRRDEYKHKLSAARVTKDLEPVFKQAQIHERNFDHKRALDAYRRLKREYPQNDVLSKQFAAKVEMYSTIIRYLEVIQRATAQGDFQSARNQYLTLRHQYSQLRFPDVRLPVSVETSPPNATVYQDGREMGVSPIQLSYSPSAVTTIRVELEGFRPEEAKLYGDTMDRVVSLLSRIPDWSTRLPGAAQHTPVADDEGRVYFTDRSGSVTALDSATGDQLWTFATRDMNGLIPTPVIQGDRLVIASLDGALRSIDRTTGELQWVTEGLPSELTPVFCGNAIVVVTTTNKLVGIDSTTREVLYSVTLPGKVKAGPVAIGRHVYTVTVSGRVLKLHGVKGQELWPSGVTVGSGARTQPTSTPRGLVFPADDGSLTLIDPRSGNQIWKQRGVGEFGSPLISAQDTLYLAQGRSLVVRRLEDGKQIKTRTGDVVWSSPPSLVGGSLLIGNQEGQVHILDPETLLPRYQIRSEGSILAMPLLAGDDVIVVVSEGGMVHGFKKF